MAQGSPEKNVTRAGRAATTHEPALRVSPVLIAACALSLVGLWLVDRVWLHTGVLTSFKGQPALSPLYAFWTPRVGAQALWFVACALALVIAGRRLCDPASTRRSTFVAGLFAFAIALPLALFCVRQDPSELGSQFQIYRNEEFWADALRIPSAGAFLEHYVELMPKLSLHGQHFPPGHALLLYVVQQLFGPSLVAAGLVVLACFALALVFAFLALRTIASEGAARQGALLLLACPSLCDFACTSMDAVFLLFAMIAWWLGLRALAPEARVRDAVLTGVSLFVASMFSFSAFPLGLALTLYALVLALTRRAWRPALRALLVIGLSYAGAMLALRALSGFALWACVAQARASGIELMTSIVGADPRVLHWKISYGNASAFLIGAGLALVPAALASASDKQASRSPVVLATLLALAIFAFGGIYFMETERIWMFAMPWLTAMAAARGRLSEASLSMLLVVGCVQTLLMELLLFTLW